MMIRKMCEEDLTQIMALENDLFSSPWPKKEYLYEMHENPFSNLYVLEEDGEIIGYYDYWVLYDQAQIATIGVKKNKQRLGYAQKMMDEITSACAKKGCETLSLEVRVSNTPAISFYEKNGFITVNVRKNYYEDNHEDAYLMVKALEGVEYDNTISD